VTGFWMVGVTSGGLGGSRWRKCLVVGGGRRWGERGAWERRGKSEK
jgi:hypothetical protein